MLLGKLVHLLGGQAGVGEHADLGGDVAPVVLGAELLEVLLEEGAHLDDAVGHLLDLGEPLLVELGGVEDLGGDAGAVDRGVGVERADENLDLRVDALLLLGVGADDGEGTDTLTVETHVLGEGLGQADVVALLDEIADGKGVLVDVAGSEALVGHVEEGVVALVLDDGLDLLPLLGGGVDTGGVVGAGVEEEDGVVGGGLEVADQTLEVEPDGVLVVVSILGDLETGVTEDGAVVGPRGGGDVDLLGSGEEAGEEGTADAEGTGTRDGLGDDETVKGGAVLAIGENGGSLGELGHTGDAGVLLVQTVVDDLVLGLANGREHVRLALVIAVGTDTCIRVRWLAVVVSEASGFIISWWQIVGGVA